MFKEQQKNVFSDVDQFPDIKFRDYHHINFYQPLIVNIFLSWWR